MGTFSKLAEIIMEDIRSRKQEEELEDMDIAHAQYEDDELNAYLEATSIMDDDDIRWACWSAAADRCIYIYRPIFQKAMSQYE